jgi:hypothetical protein
MKGLVASATAAKDSFPPSRQVSGAGPETAAVEEILPTDDAEAS